ncbi:ChpI protein [Leptospira kobayashii]|uniref:ChpI protein n=1 Tax=Leptospira kobayashii TaxID=1917830 RepID=UPI000D596F34|nr:ChpI protein [Leptospira kobayashii]
MKNKRIPTPTIAEKKAKKLGIPRSQLFARALEEFIQNHSKNSITEKLNQVYANNSNNRDSSSDILLHTLRISLKNDSW